MEVRILKDVLDVIKSEKSRRQARWRDKDPDVRSDQWLFSDGPLINELCLMLMVALRHQVERELVALAARALGKGKALSGQEFKANVDKLRILNKEGLPSGWKWGEVEGLLSLKSGKQRQQYEGPIEALRLLANSYKHESSVENSIKLKKLIGLPEVNYAPLRGSDLLREKLAVFLGLTKEAPYWDIVEHLVEASARFLDKVEDEAKLRKVKWGPVSLHPDSRAH